MIAACLIHGWPNFGWNNNEKKSKHTELAFGHIWKKIEFEKRHKTHPMRRERRVTESRGSSLWAAASSPEKRMKWHARNRREIGRHTQHNRPTFQPGTGLRVEGEFSGAEEEESETQVNRRGWWWQWSMQNFSPMYTGKIGSLGSDYHGRSSLPVWMSMEEEGQTKGTLTY